MCSTSVFTCIMTLQYYSSSAPFYLNLPLQIWQFSWLAYDSSSFSVNGIILIFWNLIVFITCSFKDLHNTSAYIMLSFYAIIWPYCKYWATAWNIFTYFCCRWFYRIIFTSIFSNKTFKACINSSWCFNSFMVLTKSQ